MPLQNFLTNLYDLSLDAAPWLILGLIVAALIKFFLPEDILKRYFSGRGPVAITRAAILGTPLPLCSCSVLPAAITLRRSGASRGSTASFLIATPENGIDSIAVSYALLGPFLTIVRPVAAIITAITAGIFTETLTKDPPESQISPNQPLDNDASCCSSSQVNTDAASSCCSSQPQPATSCCTTSTSQSSNKLIDIARYAFTDLYRDIAVWLIIGLLIAAAVQTYIPPEKLTEVGSGILPMLLMLVVGIPLYICATASTPLAAAMLLAGISPGTTIVFLLAGPATNIGSLAIIRREIGTSATTIYLASIAVCSLGAGLATDFLASSLNINLSAQLANSQHLIPQPIAIASLILLAIATLPLIPLHLRKLKLISNQTS
ncbi:SO_0444 family Cu/Zn efflux transporter [Planctomycetota bacterium]|nr:SO_0444 family Cu/Zn efflux transporter [Planctomycetota bacterium]